MNPLATFKRAKGPLVALAAISGIFLAVGCGSSGSIQSLGGGFSKASLNGQYVISQTGTAFDSQGVNLQPFSEAIVFTADGNGHLSVTADDGDQGGGTFPPLTAPETGTYSIGTDGAGSLVFNNIPNLYAITMIDDSHFYIVEQDQFATSSGLGEKQDTNAFTAAPSGSFVFKAHNVDTSSRVGGVAIAGGVISGTEDLLSFGLLSSSHPLNSTVSMSAPDSNGRGTFTLSDGSSCNYYVVSANKFYFISNIGSVEAGQAEKQTGGPFSPSTLAAGTSYVFGSSGDTSNVLGIHSAGVFTADGVASITGGAVDFVQDSTVNSNLAVSGGSYTLASTGRGQINLTLTGGSISPQIFWMVDGTRAYFLADNSAAVEDGTFSLQQGAPFTALSNQATFLMDGFDVSFKDRVGAFKPTSGGFNWKQAANAFDPNLGIFNPSKTGTSGTYQVSSNGRVTVTVTGITNSLVFYLSSNTAGVMVQEDADIGGAFTQQASQ